MAFKSLGPKTYLYPLPVLIISTYDEDGTPNAMNAAWGGIYDYNQVTVSLSNHKTTENLARNKAFTIAFADEKHVVACDYVGIVSGNKVKDKVARAGFTVTRSENVNAPVINELPLTLECKVISFTDGTLIGEIVNVLAKEEILGEDGQPDINKFVPVCYDPGHHKYVKMAGIVGNAFQDGKKIK